MQSLPINEEESFKQLLTLLQGTFTKHNTKELKEISNQLMELSLDYKKHISHLLYALTIKNFRGIEISLDLHKSIAIYLKNFINNPKKVVLNMEETKTLIKQIFQISFEPFLQGAIGNPNINNDSIKAQLQLVISYLVSIEPLLSSPSDFISLFQDLMDLSKRVSKENFIEIYNGILNYMVSLFSSKAITEENYLTFLEQFFIQIADNILNNVKNFLDNNTLDINYSFIELLRNLYDSFYLVLCKMKTFIASEKRKEVAITLLKKYGNYTLELLQFTIPLTEESKEKYINQNPLICLNEEALNPCAKNPKIVEINRMKARELQFLSYLTQLTTLPSENKMFSKIEIKDLNVAGLVLKVVELSIKSLEDLLSNKNKFNLLQKNILIQDEEDNPLNLTLFQISVFLTRGLIREPIRSHFQVHLNDFLLNVLFPCVISSQDETELMEDDPIRYHISFNDMIDNFKEKSFKTSCFFLLKKLCERFEDTTNFVLSYVLEMLRFILNPNSDGNDNFNLYLNFKKKKVIIDEFSDEFKLDFIFHVLLVLKDNLIGNKFLFATFKKIFLENQLKINAVTSIFVKLKLCKIYNTFLSFMMSNERSSQKMINESQNFAENAVAFLLNSVVQSKDNYVQSLSYEASESLEELLNTDASNNTYFVNECIQKCLKNNFEKIIDLIQFVDIPTFYQVLIIILKDIKIDEKDRNLFFKCFDKIYQKFQLEFSKTGRETKWFVPKFFDILGEFMIGVNKIDPMNKGEVAQFNAIISPLINYLKKPGEIAEFYEDLVRISVNYISMLNGINEKSVLILKNIPTIIQKEQTTGEIEYEFVSRFLNHIQKNVGETELDQEDLFKEILDIIKMSYNFEEDYYDLSKQHALLLSLQIMALNPNLPKEILKFLLDHAVYSYKIITKNTKNVFEEYGENEKLNLLSLAIVSLGFVFKSDLTFEIMLEPSKNDKGIAGEIKKIDKFLGMLMGTFYNSDGYEPSLGKCILLGICGMFNNKKLIEYFKESSKNIEYQNNSNPKIPKEFIKIFSLLQIFVTAYQKHKDVIVEKRKKLLKKELNCNFVEEDSNDDDDKDEDEEDDEKEIFEGKIQECLKNNDNLRNSDEFEYYSKILNMLETNEGQFLKEFVQTLNADSFDKFKKLSLVRNVQVNFNGKICNVPRRTVKIKKNNV